MSGEGGDARVERLLHCAALVVPAWLGRHACITCPPSAMRGVEFAAMGGRTGGGESTWSCLERRRSAADPAMKPQHCSFHISLVHTEL